MEIENQPTDFDPTECFRAESVRRLISVGDALWPLLQASKNWDTSDPFTEGVVNLLASVYFQGVTALIQIEASLVLLRAYNFEFAHAVQARAHIEHCGRIHKAAALARRVEDTGEVTAFAAKTRRLVQPFKKGGGGGFNIMSLVECLADAVPDAASDYDSLSDYSHGDFTWNMASRRISWLTARAGKVSPAISTHDKNLSHYREAMLTDVGGILRWVEEVSRGKA